MLNTISAWWHMVGVGVIVVVLILVPTTTSRSRTSSPETVNDSGWGGDGTTAFGASCSGTRAHGAC